MKAEQPRNLGYMQLAVIKVTNCQIAPQLLQYFSKVQLPCPLTSCAALAMIGTWFMFNAFLAVAATNDKLQPWVSYLFGASVVIGLMISGAILMLP
jgi:hypothetical protein